MESNTLFNKYQNAQSFCNDAFDIVQQLCASSNNLPESGEEYDFYQSFTDVADVLTSFRSRLLNSVNKLLKAYTSSPQFGSHDGRIDEHLEHLIEANDELLERVSNGLDEASGVKKHSTTTVVKAKTSWRSPAIRYSTGLGMSMENDVVNRGSDVSQDLITPQSILKPQLRFADRVDNSNFPFIPKLTSKPHAQKPLPYKLTFSNRKITADALRRQPEILQHPYLFELESFEPCALQMSRMEPKPSIHMDQCPFMLINSEIQLKKVIDLVEQSFTEVAFDLEHHNLRSYMGFTCLVQMSTRDADYVFDAFSLRENLQMLNRITANSNILKVFHGADSDIVWLQKDFGVYVVNMFDTHQAARLLGFPYLSLSYLLKRYCDVDAAKRYQRADWRIRPLPSELVDYARTDTHYLLYIYDNLRNELIDKGATTSAVAGSIITNLLQAVYERSRTICMKRYEKPMFDDSDYLKLVKDSCRVFNTRQLHALKLIYSWRDRVAREEDESPDYVLPNHMLMKIAEYLPKEKQGIFGCCNPIPNHVKQNLIEIHQYVISAREVELKKQGDDQPSEIEYMEPPPFDPESVLNCVHDHIHCSDTTTKEFKDPPSLWKLLVEVQKNRNTLKPSSDLKTTRNLMFSCKTPTKKETTSAKRLCRHVLKELHNPLIPYLPSELHSSLDRDYLKGKKSIEKLSWSLLRPEGNAFDRDEESNSRNARIEVLPTPAEINNADDIVPLKRRKIKTIAPPIPLLPSCLEKFAADKLQQQQKQIKVEVTNSNTTIE